MPKGGSVRRRVEGSPPLRNTSWRGLSPAVDYGELGPPRMSTRRRVSELAPVGLLAYARRRTAGGLPLM
jgi:hypothetical protein